MFTPDFAEISSSFIRHALVIDHLTFSTHLPVPVISFIIEPHEYCLGFFYLHHPHNHHRSAAMADTPSTSTAESSKMQTPATGTRFLILCATVTVRGIERLTCILPEGLPTRPKMEASTSLEGLQSEKQALVLDTVTQIRKCGLDSILSLPQLVVCGDQSAGKSSVLEALTEIPFPRADNLCTRFATEVRNTLSGKQKEGTEDLKGRSHMKVSENSWSSFHCSIVCG